MIVAGCVSAAVYVAIAVLSRQFIYGSTHAERPILMVLGLLALLFVLYLAALWAAVRSGESRRLLGVIVLGSVLMRLVLVFSWPIQEVDIYRYLWDGEVAAHGESPFRYSPKQVLDADADGLLPAELGRLVELRDSSPAVATILSRVHYEELPTIYPPVSQAVFAFCSLITPQGATVFPRLAIMKGCFVLFDLGTLAVVIGLLRIAGRHIGWSLAYGWCPLVVKEIAGSGHLDAIAVFLTSAAVWIIASALFRKTSSRTAGLGLLAAAVLGLAVGAKLYPIVLAPLFAATWIGRFGWRRTIAGAVVFTTVVALLLWPMMPTDSSVPDTSSAILSVGMDPQGPGRSLKAFFGRWEMNDFLFMLVVENVKPDGGRPSEERPWFAVVPDAWRTNLVERPTVWFGVDAAAAAFLLTRIVTSAVFLVVLGVLAWHAAGSRESVDWLRSAFLTIAWFWLLSPTQNPWYWIWAMPLVVFARSRVWLAVSGLVLVYYLRFWLDYHWPDGAVPDVSVPGIGYSGSLTFDYVVTWVEFAPWFALLAFSWAYRRFGRIASSQ
ncbi:MAG: hypothetical protein V3R99_03385 [Thermoguttaceae bacterium]